jgi:hypothetical protein
LIIYERVNLFITVYNLDLASMDEDHQMEWAGDIDIIREYAEAEENEGK